MKIKNKGKVYPSPSPEPDALAVFKLLPAAILALASLLSPEDREVLAYLITRSLKTTTTTTNNPSDSRKKSSKKPPPSGAAAKTHKPPISDCECFDCYTSYWVRWDSSPNRELINQAIELFEDHLAHGEKSKKTTRAKRRDKTHHRNNLPLPPPEILQPPPSTSRQDCPARSDDEAGKRVQPEEAVGEPPVVVAAAETSGHKGLARKVLPDVLGLFNSRLWSLWGPNV